MQAVILAAGRGTRMRPLTDTLAKPLIPIAGKALLSHVIDSLPTCVHEIIVVVGHRGNEVVSHCIKMFPKTKFTFVEQKTLGGTLAALNLTRTLVEGPFLVFTADDIIDKRSLENLAHAEAPALLVALSQEPERYGVVETDKDDIVIGIEEKPAHPRSHLVSIGTMLLDDRIFNCTVTPAKNGELYLSNALATLAKTVPVKAIDADLWISVGSIDDIANAEHILGSRAL